MAGLFVCRIGYWEKVEVRYRPNSLFAFIPFLLAQTVFADRRLFMEWHKVIRFWYCRYPYPYLVTILSTIVTYLLYHRQSSIIWYNIPAFQHISFPVFTEIEVLHFYRISIKLKPSPVCLIHSACLRSIIVVRYHKSVAKWDN